MNYLGINNLSFAENHVNHMFIKLYFYIFKLKNIIP